MNTVIVCPNQQTGFVLSHNLYTMDVDRENRNCYNCGEFGYLARNCRNREIESRIRESRKLEYKNRNNRQNNLNGEGGLIILD